MDWVWPQGWASRSTPASSSTSVVPTAAYNDAEGDALTDERKSAARTLHSNGKHGISTGASASDGHRGRIPSDKVKHTPLGCNHPRPSHRVPSPVILNIYHLGQNVLTRAFNGLTRNGAYHSGLVVGGKEWSFGMTLDNYSTGVTWTVPKMHPDHTFRESLFLGNTKFSNGDVFLMLEELKRQWLGCRYNVWTRNCHHFSSEFCRLLGVEMPPDWLNKLATQGNSMQVALDGESTEFDGGEAVVDFFSSLTGAIRDFFTLGDTVDDARNGPRRVRLSPPVSRRSAAEHTRSSTRYAPVRLPAGWETRRADSTRTNGVFGHRGDSQRYHGACEPGREEWQNKWHDKRRRFDDEEMNGSDASDAAWGDELDVLARNATRNRSSHRSSSSRIVDWGGTRALEGDGGLRGTNGGLRADYADDVGYHPNCSPDRPDYHCAGTIESLAYTSSMIPTAEDHAPRPANDTPSAGPRNKGSATLWDALWPSPKGVGRLRSAPERKRINRGIEGSSPECNGRNGKASVVLRRNDDIGGKG
eukprot:GEMP01019735.1.p1 GENE.GEMP01019735.1~~GEMP01019735.1.p1  ORF type:complete len:530 (+),score=123.40 GEMP01019735.1:184-1773(+)